MNHWIINYTEKGEARQMTTMTNQDAASTVAEFHESLTKTATENIIVA